MWQNVPSASKVRADIPYLSKGMFFCYKSSDRGVLFESEGYMCYRN
jgi:hypothetical protein